MSRRRGPWCSGLVVALLGSVWLAGQVFGGLLSWAGELVGDSGSGAAAVWSDAGGRF